MRELSDAEVFGELSDEEVFGRAAPKAPAKTKPAPKPSLARESRGALAQVYRGTGILDEVQGGLNAFGNVLTGKSKIDPLKAGAFALSSMTGNAPGLVKNFNESGLRSAFEQGMKEQRGIEDDYAARRPRVASALKTAGTAAPMFVPGGQFTAPVNASRAGNMARGAVTAAGTAAVYGAADRGTPKERLDTANAFATNPVVLGLGAGAGALAPVAQKAPTPSQERGQVLKDMGVSTSVLQRWGKQAKQFEDLLMRFPIIGQAISGARDRQIAQLNRGIGLHALKPIGGTIPKDVKPGFEMVQHVDDEIGKVYTRAAKMVPPGRGVADQALEADLLKIDPRKADLTDEMAGLYDRIIAERMKRLTRPDADGALVKQVHGELGGLQAEFAKKGEMTLAGMIGDARRAVMGIVERADPRARTMVRQADKAWGMYSIMNDAAAAAANRGGVFLPGQLVTQSKAAGRALGPNMVGKGRAPLQEQATAAAALLPDSYGNPGTANAALVSGGGVGAFTAPVETATAAAGLTAASTPYFLMARKVLEELPPSASAAQLNQASARLAQLAQRDPAVAQLQAEVAARLARAGGLAGAGTQSRPTTPAMPPAYR